MMKKWIADIKEKTFGMSRKDKIIYIRTYYWYHILISISIIGLLFLFLGHYLFGNEPLQFLCAVVNRPVSFETADHMAETFAAKAGLDPERTYIDPDFIFSYGDVVMNGANEGSYEKFFLQWRNQEIDAAIMTESFFLYCKNLGGEFCILDEKALGDFEAYMDQGSCKGAVLGYDSLTKSNNGNANERLLLVFPDTGKNNRIETENTFLAYMNALKAGRIGGVTYEEVIN